MTVNIDFNGTTYPFPTTGNVNWGQTVTSWAQNVSNAAVTLTGTQTLSNKTITFASGTVGSPSVSFTADTHTGLYLIGTSQLGLVTDSTLRLEVDASGNVVVVGADNSLELAGSATGDAVTITATGSDSDIDIEITPKGTGAVVVDGNVSVSGDVEFTGTLEAASLAAVGADNTLTLTGSATTDPLTIVASGTDTDIDIEITPKGAGLVVLDGDASVEGDLDLNSNSITNLATPSASTDAATKGYVDGLAIGKNRIINGAMNISQRFETTTATINSTSTVYTLDRWRTNGQAADGVFTVIRSTSTPPAGFPNFARITATTADASIGSSQSYMFSQAIEGTNCWDLGFGLSTASSVTLSFWVRSSLSGTFGGCIQNSAANRSYPFSYTINATNTWEQKTITIAGDTTGTWLTTNGIGMFLNFNIGAGSSLVSTAGAWAAANYLGATGNTNVIGTLNATWDITGVQLEKGSTATGFDFRPATTELQLCQRYFAKRFNQGIVPAAALSGSGGTTGALVAWFANIAAFNFCYANWPFPVEMRTTATITRYCVATSGTNWSGFQTSGDNTPTSSTAFAGSAGACLAGSGAPGNNAYSLQATADAEL